MKAKIEERLVTLETQLEQAKSNLQALAGAIQILQLLLNEWVDAADTPAAPAEDGVLLGQD
jgi:hypothetical protein